MSATPLQVYNSYTRQKENFEPITPGYAGMYVCGPTVSGESHLGHARPYITFDLVYRYLTHLGYKVRYVRNITDAGHFEEEGREAEDKISKKAVLEKLEPMELVTKYTNLFRWAMQQFNNVDPSIEPTATGHIVEQIEMIKQIMAEGYAYESQGSVYFDVKKYAEHYDYGKLSGRVVDELLTTTRQLSGQSEKQDSADFALWKNAPPEHIMRWASPWGEGFPGWHIECSAMSAKYLGDEFDIHGGGMDLQFPHHESEIAQSRICHHGKLMARYWLHNNMITINGRKMGKSYNNVIKLTELFSGQHPMLQQAYHPMAVRFFILQSHYRSTLDFGNEGLKAAEKALKRLWEAYTNIGVLAAAAAATPVVTNPTDTELDQSIHKRLDEFSEFMSDDFNTAKVLANMFELAPIINGIKAGQVAADAVTTATLNRLNVEFKIWLEDVLGLKSPMAAAGADKFEGAIALLIDLRKQAKARRDFATSDSIRLQLQAMGVLLKDEKNGDITWAIA